ncbi:hypothetical protein QTP88_007293 [Uroleucon formosanum]
MCIYAPIYRIIYTYTFVHLFSDPFPNLRHRTEEKRDNVKSHAHYPQSGTKSSGPVDVRSGWGKSRGALGAPHPRPVHTSASHCYPIIVVLPLPRICKIVLYYLFYAVTATAARLFCPVSGRHTTHAL